MTIGPGSCLQAIESIVHGDSDGRLRVTKDALYFVDELHEERDGSGYDFCHVCGNHVGITLKGQPHVRSAANDRLAVWCFCAFRPYPPPGLDKERYTFENHPGQVPA